MLNVKKCFPFFQGNVKMDQIGIFGAILRIRLICLTHTRHSIVHNKHVGHATRYTMHILRERIYKNNFFHFFFFRNQKRGLLGKGLINIGRVKIIE